jgi:hypothetical protein
MAAPEDQTCPDRHEHGPADGFHLPVIATFRLFRHWPYSGFFLFCGRDLPSLSLRIC